MLISQWVILQITMVENRGDVFVSMRVLIAMVKNHCIAYKTKTTNIQLMV